MTKQQSNMDLSSASMHRLAMVAPVAVSNIHVIVCFVA
jgi:hypothetical protein